MAVGEEPAVINIAKYEGIKNTLVTEELEETGKPVIVAAPVELPTVLTAQTPANVIMLPVCVHHPA
jgi:hypothetical protein